MTLKNVSCNDFNYQNFDFLFYNNDFLIIVMVYQWFTTIVFFVDGINGLCLMFCQKEWLSYDLMMAVFKLNVFSVKTNGKSNCGTCLKNQWNAYQSNSCLHLLTGLLKCETRYQEFPNMLFAVHLMLRVGEDLCALKHTNDSSVQVWRLGQLYNKRSAEWFTEGKSLLDWQVSVEAQEHGVNQILWYCLLSYHCVQNNGTRLSQVIKQLMLLQAKLQHDNWCVKCLGDALHRFWCYVSSL